MSHRILVRKFALICCAIGLAQFGVEPCLNAAEKTAAAERKLLYVATPGIRDELQYGGHGILVFDVAGGHNFMKRIPSAGRDESGKPLNVKGICANAKTQRL